MPCTSLTMRSIYAATALPTSMTKVERGVEVRCGREWGINRLLWCVYGI